MKTLLFFVLTATLASTSLAQWELRTSIKTRSEFPGIQMVSDQVGQAIDFRPGATKA
jgi:hypothetical protein